MIFKLLLLFTLVPVLELYLMIEVGSRIGPLLTVGIILWTGLAGAYLANSQGLQVVKKINDAASQGRLPGRELLEGLMVLIGGVLLLTPGFFTDLLGLSLIFPLTRSGYAGLLARYIKRKVQAGTWTIEIGRRDLWR